MTSTVMGLTMVLRAAAAAAAAASAERRQFIPRTQACTRVAASSGRCGLCFCANRVGVSRVGVAGWFSNDPSKANFKIVVGCSKIKKKIR